MSAAASLEPPAHARQDEDETPLYTQSSLGAWRHLVGDLHVEGMIAIAAVVILWQAASYFLPPFLFPSVGDIGRAIREMLADTTTSYTVRLTIARIILFVLLSFISGTGLGIVACLNGRTERTVTPLIQLSQGIPGVCWIIFAALWFRNMELRIAFVIVISTLPSFFFMAREGFRAIPRELWDMVQSWRPTRSQFFTKLIVPSLLPQLLNALRLNLGTGTRVTIMAELLAGNSGIGNYLRSAQEQFRMDVAIAWTAILVVFVLLLDAVLTKIEHHLLRWRHSLRSSR